MSDALKRMGSEALALVKLINKYEADNWEPIEFALLNIRDEWEEVKCGEIARIYRGRADE